MWKWVKTMLGGTTHGMMDGGIWIMPQLSRQELSELFADDLARPMLQKRSEAMRKQPRRLMAGRQPQCA